MSGFKFLLFIFSFSLSLEGLAADTLSYSGRLVNANGSPVTGPVDLKFEYAYTDSSPILSVICDQTITNISLTNGVFHVKLPATCGGTNLQAMTEATPDGEALAIRVTDLTHTKTYSYQAFHSMPYANVAQTAKQLVKMGATAGQVLQFDGTVWKPVTLPSSSEGTLTEIQTGTGLTGGPITTTGTISIANGGVDTAQLADGSVTDGKIATGVARSKIAAGTANYVLINDNFGFMSQVEHLPLSQGGTGAGTAASARTNLGLGTAAVRDTGIGATDVLIGGDVASCLPTEKLYWNTLGPTFGWTCVVDNDSLDSTKLPLDGSQPMTGALDMNSHKILGVTTPTNPDEAANKAYVDAQVGSVTSSQWETSGIDIYYDTGKVGVGLTAPAADFHVHSSAGATIKLTDSTSGAGTSDGSSITQSGTTLAIQNDESGPIQFVNGGSNRLVISSTGNVGIPTATATEKLNVVGDARVSGGVRFASDNTNYVELRAPTGLASTLVFKLPGTAGSSGNALITDGSGNLSWAAVATTGTGLGGDLTGTIADAQIGTGVVGSAEISDASIVDADIAAGAAIAQSKIANLTSDLAAKEGAITAGTTSQYYRGDKSWQTLDTDSVPEATRLYFTEARVLGTDLAGFASTTGIISASDTILSALEKLTGNLAALSSDQGNYVLKAGDTMSGALAMGGNKITGVDDPTDPQDAATKAYVDTAVAGGSQWVTSGSDIYYNSGNVGIATTSPQSKLHIGFDGNSAASGTLSLGAGAFDGVTADHFGSGTASNANGTIIAVNTGSSYNGDFLNFQVAGDSKFKLTKSGQLSRLSSIDFGAVGAITMNSGATSMNMNGFVSSSGQTTGYHYNSSGGFFTSGGSYNSSSSSNSFTGNLFRGTYSGTNSGTVARFSITNAAASGTALVVSNAGTGNAATFDGKVGIGTTTPGSALDVKGTLHLSGSTSGYVGFAPAANAGSTTYTLPAADGSSGYVLSTNGSGVLSWTAISGAPSGAAGGDLSGSYPNPTISGLDATKISDGSISNTEFGHLNGVTSNVQTQLDGKEGAVTAGTTSQYYRGDKSWQTLDTDAVTEANNLYFTEERVRDTFLGTDYAVGTAIPLSDGDTFLEALGKLEAYIASISTSMGTGDFKKDGSEAMTGTLKATLGTAALPGYTFDGDPDTGMYSPTSNVVAITTNGSEKLRVSANGYVGIGTTSPATKLSSSSASITDSANTSVNTTGLVWSGSGAGYIAGIFNGSTGAGNGLVVKVAGNAATNNALSVDYGSTQLGNGTSLFRVLGNGNVGVGIAAPTAKLEVAGQIKITGGTPGAGKVLTSDANGLATWEDAPSGEPSGAAGGDLSGTYPNPTISGLDASKLSDGSISNTEFGYLDGVSSNIQTQLDAKEGELTAGTSAQYYRGDKTWATLDTTAVAEGANFYFTEARVRGTLLGTGYAVGTAIPLAAGDSVLTAIGKLEANIASVQSSGQWTKSSNDIYYTGGNVGIGTSPTASAGLHVSHTGNNYFDKPGSGSNGVGSLIQLRSSNGSSGSPSASASGSALGTLGFTGLSSSGYQTNSGARITAIATQGWANTTAHGTALTFRTTENNTAGTVERMRIDHNGKVGIGLTSPASALHVLGGIQLGDDTSTCPGASNEKLGTLRFNGGTKLQVCLASGWGDIGVSTGSVTGSYTGDGAASKTITLGFRPKLVVVKAINGTYNGQHIMIDGIPDAAVHLYSYDDVNNAAASMVKIRDTGFEVSGPVNDSAANVNGRVYHYIAIGNTASGSGGSLTAGSVTSTELASNAVTSDKIQNGTVTVDDLSFASSNGINIPQLAADPASGTAGQIYYNSSSKTLMYYNGTSWTQVGSGTSGNAPVAWASFNGTGTLSINNSHGVSSIVRIATGKYRVTWSTPFPDRNYIVLGTCNMMGTGGAMFGLEGNNIAGHANEGFKPATVDIGCRDNLNDPTNTDLVHVMAFSSTAAASGTIAANSLESSHIVDQSITGSDLAAGSIQHSISPASEQLEACSSEQFLKWNVVTGWTCTDVSSIGGKWTGSTDISYSGGNVGIGTASPAAKLDVAGEVKFGNTSSTCNSTNEGQQRYNSTSKVMEFCNGTAWTAFATASTSGRVTGGCTRGSAWGTATSCGVGAGMTCSAGNTVRIVVYTTPGGTAVWDSSGNYAHGFCISN
jgi:hypothetical protein